jgi:hypothetical protein
VCSSVLNGAGVGLVFLFISFVMDFSLHNSGGGCCGAILAAFPRLGDCSLITVGRVMAFVGLFGSAFATSSDFPFQVILYDRDVQYVDRGMIFGRSHRPIRKLDVKSI